MRFQESYTGPVCPDGCDPRFLEFVFWRGTRERILVSAWRGMQQYWKGCLRCSDCGSTLPFTNLLSKDKQALEKWASEGRRELEEVCEQYDRERDEKELAFFNWCAENGRLGVEHAA